MRISDWSSDVCSSDLMMLTWQELDQLVHHRPGGAVARVPANAPGGAVEPLHQPGDVAVHDGDSLDLPSVSAPPVAPVARRRHAPQIRDVRPKKGLVMKYQLEAVMIGGIEIGRAPV